MNFPNKKEVESYTREQLEQLWNDLNQFRTLVHNIYHYQFAIDREIEEHRKKQKEALKSLKDSKVKYIGALFDCADLKKIDWDDLEKKIMSGKPPKIYACGYMLYYDTILECWALGYDYGNGGHTDYFFKNKTHKLCLRVKERYLQSLKSKEKE